MKTARSEGGKAMIGGANGKRMMARLKRLLGVPCALQAAALPWRTGKDGLQILLVTSRGTGRWVLPKGWPKKHEFPHQAALREAEEEAGLTGRVAPREAGRYFYDKGLRDGSEKRCEVLVYPVEVERLAGEWAERAERQRKWMTPEQAAASVAEPDLAALIKAFGRSRVMA